MRCDRPGYAIVYEVNTEDPEAPLTYSHCMEFPAHLSKFIIKYDEISGKYWTIGCEVYDRNKPWARNLLVLLASEDLKSWNRVKVLLDYRHQEHRLVGFQYVDFSFEGDDIIYLLRTAINESRNFHDANYMTFNRIEQFRDLLSYS